ncbi:hypothetical protein [Streptomyces sp. NPDC058326]|uniref:hypothetical protein n=1 Tax=Streptomyces sp. NPDC058326 TaxID=3346447 RepID=UPI0036EB26A3
MHLVRRSPRARTGRGVRGGGARRARGRHDPAARDRHHPGALVLARDPFALLLVPFFRHAVRGRRVVPPAVRVRLSGAPRRLRYATAPGARADRHRVSRALRAERRAQRRPRPQRLRLARGPARR